MVTLLFRLRLFHGRAIASLTRHYALRVRRGSNALCFLAAAYVATGQDEKARAAMKAYLDENPTITC